MKKPQSLVDMAKGIKKGRSPRVVTDEDIDLFLAFLRGEVNGTQCAEVSGKDRTSWFVSLACGLRDAVCSGKVQILRKE